MQRIISNNFIYDLQSGILRNILKYVKSDTTLAMEIRKDCINIYYRGGSLLKVKEVGENIYNGYFDKNYIKAENSQSVVVECISGINNLSKANKLIEYIPKIKQQMDLWMKIEMPDGGEREYKHIVAKENNYGLIGKESDYFIGDIEYRGCLNNYLFDMIGIKWPVENENTDNLDLALFKMYYGDKNLKSSKEIINDIYKLKGELVMNLVVLSGRLSTEPSLKYLEGSGFAISKFNLAVQKEYYKNDDDKVEFFNIECWNKLAESVANNLDKGRKILVHGYLKQNIWSDENNKTHKNTSIVAKRIEFLDYPKEINNTPNFEPIYYDEESIF